MATRHYRCSWHRPPQVSSLNRVFEGVEGIDILQVQRARPRSRFIRTQLIITYDLPSLLRPSPPPAPSATGSRFCIASSDSAPPLQRAAARVQARVSLLCRRRRHRLPAPGKRCPPTSTSRNLMSSTASSICYNFSLSIHSMFCALSRASCTISRVAPARPHCRPAAAHRG
jgi:hypothetical protein